MIHKGKIKSSLVLSISILLPIFMGVIFFQVVAAGGNQNTSMISDSQLAADSLATGTTIEVTTEADELNSDGDCSLREALQAANTDTSVDACPAGSGWDTITIPTGTFRLTEYGSDEDANATGDLDVLDSVTITGAGSDATILDGDSADRVLHVDPDMNQAVTLDLKDVTITNGDSDYGGGLRAHSGLTIIQDSVIHHNQASENGGGLQVDFGTLRVYSSTVEYNTASDTGSGGGIYIDNAAVTLYSSTVFTNSANLGAGLYTNYGSVSLQGTKVISNTTSGSDGYGGGIYSSSGNVLIEDDSEIGYNQAEGYGGGIYAEDSSRLSITESWIHHNLATTDDGGGVYLAGPGTFVSNSTIEYNTAEDDGGGFYAENDLIILSSTLAHNHAEDSSEGGGGIFQSQGTLVISDTVVFSNTTPGYGGGVYFYRYGGLFVQNSVFTENLAQEDGGAIYTSYAVGTIIEDSAFTGNKGYIGGAIMIEEDSALTIERSTFSDNWATMDGGALYLYNYAPTDIRNSTFSSNHADDEGGAIYVYWPGPLIEYTTIVSNTAGTSGGGIYSDYYAEPFSSIIAGNSAGGSTTASAADCYISEKLFSGGYNLFGQNTGCEATRYDQTISPGSVFVSLLEPLADNGGAELPDGSHPKTHAVRNGSRAIDAGDDVFCPAADQRGETRPQGNACDAGSYESGHSATPPSPTDNVITVNTTDDELNTDGDCSLREAIQAANTDAAVDACTAGNGWDTISLSAETYTLSLAGVDEDNNATGDLDIKDYVTIRGVGSDQTKIDGDHIDRVFDQNESTLYLVDLTVTRGNTITPTDDKGGCIHNYYGLHILLDSEVSYCRSDNYGGGIYNTGSVYRMVDSTLTENYTSSENGGVYIDDGVGSIESSTIISNTGNSYGGGVMSYVANTRITASDIVSNTVTDGSGGAIYHAYGTLIVDENSKINNNYSTSDGGGIYADDGALLIEDSTIGHNYADSDGGGIYGDYGLWMRNSLVEYNQANSYGGGIYGGGYIQDSTIQHNKSASGGGGLYTWGTIENSQVYDNEAPYGGGIYAEGVTLINSTVNENRALSFDGGGVYIDNGSSGGAVIIESSVLDNQGHSGEEGAGLYTETRPVTVRGSTFSGNSGADLGGAIYSETVVDLINSTVSGNHAVTGAGFYNLGSLSLNSSTVADNRGSTSAGGIYNAQVATIENSIVAGNQASGSLTNTTADCLETDPITYAGYSLFGSGTGCNASGRNDQTVPPAEIFTDVLAPLADNGGPTSGTGQPAYTHALLTDSPALDTIPSGVSGCSTTIDVDQRGVTRPQADSCDSGAYEAEAQSVNVMIYLPLLSR